MDLNSDSFSDANEPHDALADRLRQEAMVERPTFSPELHHRIFDHIHIHADEAQSAFRPRRLLKYAAAIAIFAVLLALSWSLHSQRTSTPTSPNPVVVNGLQPVPAPHQVKPSPGSLEFQIAGVVSADLLPPRLELHLASLDLYPADSAPTVRDTTPTRLPDGLLAALPNPATRAGESLTDVVPPSFRLLLPLVRQAVARAATERVE